MEDYLSRFQDFVLSPMGLSMTLRSSSGGTGSAERRSSVVHSMVAAAHGDQRFSQEGFRRGLLTAA